MNFDPNIVTTDELTRTSAPMRASIEVESRDEADLIRTGLDDPAVRAVAKIIGALTPLTDRGRKRVMAYVIDAYQEQADGQA